LDRKVLSADLEKASGVGVCRCQLPFSRRPVRNCTGQETRSLVSLSQC